MNEEFPAALQGLRQFPADLLFTSSSGELWKMVRIGGQPLGFDKCGTVGKENDQRAHYAHPVTRQVCSASD